MANKLALDLGTLCGWSLLMPGGVVISGNLNMQPLPPTKKRAKEHPGLRYRKFSNLLCDLSANYGEINEIAYEDVKSHTGTAPAHIWGAYRAILELFALNINANLYPYGVGVAKVESVGLGRASKESTQAFVKAWLDYDCESEDEADSLAILYCHLKSTNQMPKESNYNFKKI